MGDVGGLSGRRGTSLVAGVRALGRAAVKGLCAAEVEGLRRHGPGPAEAANARSVGCIHRGSTGFGLSGDVVGGACGLRHDLWVPVPAAAYGVEGLKGRVQVSTALGSSSESIFSDIIGAALCTLVRDSTLFVTLCLRAVWSIGSPLAGAVVGEDAAGRWGVGTACCWGRHRGRNMAAGCISTSVGWV